ncbi:hypothetical protein GCM10023084_45370 [Streptomyces lacrimifluminis]|uniref:Uncharacterized protein n=1 Tax=Streptomyces lacrimifluminis TaxID=1500077 RepID=A0A917L8K2_9ACTN|nr:hypothetical protein GCM10012282_47470 [Streptomyces lacrimifluminis]
MRHVDRITAALSVRRDSGGTQDKKAVGTGRKETSGEGDDPPENQGRRRATGVRRETAPKKL